MRDSVFRALWLATQPSDIHACSAIHWFTSSSSKRATPNSRKSRTKWLAAVCCRSKQSNFTKNQIIQTDAEIHEGDEIRFGSSPRSRPKKERAREREKKTGKKVFVYKYKLSLALLYLADMFINKLNGRQSRLNSFFFLQNRFKYKKNSLKKFRARAETNAFICRTRSRESRRFGQCAPKL